METRAESSQNTAELTVVIPVYNEQPKIESVLGLWWETLEGLGIDFYLHVYNDGSTDGSQETIKSFAANHERVIIHDKPNSGHGPTILLGYRENKDSEWIFQTDSDGEISPDSFAELWRNREDHDFLYGRRIRYNGSFTRRLISIAARVIVSVLYSQRVKDVNSPYRLMRSSFFKGYYPTIPEDTFAPNLILSGIAGFKGARIFEVKVKHSQRPAAESSLRKFTLLKAAARSLLQTVIFRFKV